jgi:lipoate-protein ligase A
MNTQQQLEEDFAMLDRVEDGGPAEFRLWRVAGYAVVLGRSLIVEREVHEEACHERGISILQRKSGGGAVLIGPGTLQYAFALPHVFHPALRDIPAAKALCNGLLVEALGHVPGLTFEANGDLVVGQRKAAGIALRRRRRSVLVHGTILTSADLSLISAVLRHPSREPSYRLGRTHQDFLTNIGEVDVERLTATVRRGLDALGKPGRQAEN